jgi:hypothetical protein
MTVCCATSFSGRWPGNVGLRGSDHVREPLEWTYLDDVLRRFGLNDGRFAGCHLALSSSALLGVYLTVSIKNSAGNFCRFGTRTLQSYGMSAYQRALDD